MAEPIFVNVPQPLQPVTCVPEDPAKVSWSSIFSKCSFGVLPTSSGPSPAASQSQQLTQDTRTARKVPDVDDFQCVYDAKPIVLPSSAHARSVSFKKSCLSKSTTPRVTSTSAQQPGPLASSSAPGKSVSSSGGSVATFDLCFGATCDSDTDSVAPSAAPTVPPPRRALSFSPAKDDTSSDAPAWYVFPLGHEFAAIEAKFPANRSRTLLLKIVHGDDWVPYAEALDWMSDAQVKSFFADGVQWYRATRGTVVAENDERKALVREFALGFQVL